MRNGMGRGKDWGASSRPSARVRPAPERAPSAHAAVPVGESALGETEGYGYRYWIGAIDGPPVHYHADDIVGYRSMYVSVLNVRASIAILSDRDETRTPSIARCL